jgi:hypothetical protein
VRPAAKLLLRPETTQLRNRRERPSPGRKCHTRPADRWRRSDVGPAIPLRAMGRLRASDGEREETVALLGRAAADGRLDVRELEVRAAQAYAATTRHDLVQLLEDLPSANLRPRETARAQWQVLGAPRQAANDLHAFAGQLLELHGYFLHVREADRIVFMRGRWRKWTKPLRYVLPMRMMGRLRERETVTFELYAREETTTIVASGSAPAEVWRVLATLEG